MAPFPFQIVGFDLDGTLLDTHGDLGVALNHALARAGLAQVPMAVVPRLVGGGSRLMMQRALAHIGHDGPVDLDTLYADLIAHYAENIAVHTRLYPGGAAMLDALEEAGATLAMVTNKPQALADRLMAELGLTDRFACIIGGGAGYPLKPAPDALHAMVERCGGGTAAFVGDTTFDTRAAKAANLPCVAVSFGFCDADPADLGAGAVIDHFSDLVPALRNLGAAATA